MKLKALLTLAIASLCSWQGAWADRSAPELPEAVAPVSGTSYYLYNVMEGKFLSRSSSSTSYPAIATYGEKITIKATSNEDEYTIQFASNNYYFSAYDSYVTSRSSVNALCYFTLAESSKGYTIQRSSTNTTYYKADEYIGYNGNNSDRLNPQLAEGSIHWVFFPVDEAEHYMAMHKLYTYLEAADSYNFYINQYELVYENEASTTEELLQAYETLYDAVTMSTSVVSPSWTDYPIIFQNNTNNKWTTYSGELRWKNSNVAEQRTTTLVGTVNVDEESTLVYTYKGSNDFTNLRTFIDGELVQTVTASEGKKNRNYYIELPIGKHDIIWECVFNGSSSTKSNTYYSYLSNIGIEKTPTLVTEQMTVEGQLGTEVLKQIDHVKDVRKLVVNGPLGEDDWTNIKMMTSLFSIDLSNAVITTIPASTFTKSNFAFLHEVKLPEGLTSIGNKAFDGSDIEDIIFPTTLESIGNSAFASSKVQSAYIPESVTSVGTYAFDGCYFLKNASFPAAATTIPQYCFRNCNELRTFEIPEGITQISREAFANASQFNPRFPSSLTTVNYHAFYNTAIDSLFVSENMTVYYGAFSNCSSLVYAEWPTSFATVKYSGVLESSISHQHNNCPKLNKLYLKSPTVLRDENSKNNYYKEFLKGCTNADLTIYVPSFLVNAYKLDPYWYNYNIAGFNTADVKDWYINHSLTLEEGQRFDGQPNITLRQQGALKINGDNSMTVDKLYTCKDWGTGDWQTMILSNCNQISISGQYRHRVYTPAKKWVFICLPFDTKVGDITSQGSFAIRYYDGASRAENGTGSSWKNYSQDDIIPAGTGFILQTSKQCSTYFYAQDNASKNNVFSNNEFVKSLEVNASEVTANKGWNLVGNPWLSYYNIHKVNFTAPITCWNISKSTYTAYSIIDDDYAILPGEAFFVQCPDEINSISFPIDGRQLTSVIESQNGARPFGELQASARKLIDIELTDGEMADKTRFVLNPQAKIDYETTCDASKFFSMDNSVPQIYTIQNGVQMAINERPAGDGIVKLGMTIPADGTYTIQSVRNDLTNAVLVDLQNGTETNLSTDSYTFSAKGGTNDSRFELRLSGSSSTTGISDTTRLLNDEAIRNSNIYNLNGQRISAPQKGIYVVNGKKVINK